MEITMSQQIFYFPPLQALSTTGSPLAGAKLNFFLTGTSTAATVYADAGRSTALSNPIVADGNGRFQQLYPDPDTVYRVQLTDSSGTQQWLQDGESRQLFTRTAAEVAAGVTPTNYGYMPGFLQRYGASTSATDNQAAINAAISVLNAGGGAITVSGGAYLTSGLNTIAASNAQINFLDGSVLRVVPDSWGTSGDGTTFLNITGTGARLYNVSIDGNQASFNPNTTPVGRLIQFGDDTLMVGCSFQNSPSQGARTGGTGARIMATHFDNNANVGLDCDVASYMKFSECSFNYNGYGFQRKLATNQFAAFGLVLRYRSHHFTFVNCEAMQNGRDGMCTNQGSYAIKYVGCTAWMNGDGGFTLANDFVAGGPPGNAESPYDIEYVDCEAYNNYTSGIASYCASINVTVDGGRFYNNGYTMGVLPFFSSFPNGIYFAAGSTGIRVRAKCYDDRQRCLITANSAGTLSATGWVAGTIGNYPRVALYDANLVFQGYATATSETTGSVTVTYSRFAGTASQPSGSSIMTVSAVTSGSLSASDVIAGTSAAATITAVPVTFVGTTIPAGQTSGTLSSAWTYPTGTYNVTFSDGEVRAVTLTNGATSATWAGGLTSSPSNAASTFGNNDGGVGTYIVNSTTGFASTFITANQGISSLSAPVAGWYVSQRVQHNGCFFDNNCIGSIDIDGFGFLPGPVGFTGFKSISGPYTGGQNVLLPAAQLDYTELLINPTFDADISNWSISRPGDRSAVNYYTTAGFGLRSPGALQLIAGSANAAAQALTIPNYLNYVSNGAFVEASIWAYCTTVAGALLELVWNPGGGTLISSAWHPGGGWRQLKIGGYMPPTTTQLYIQVIVLANAVGYFDTATLRVKSDAYDNRDFSYPTRNLPV
jgi:hypothetical protein